MAKIDSTLAEPSIRDGEMDAGFSNERSPGLPPDTALKKGPQGTGGKVSDEDLMRGYTDG